MPDPSESKPNLKRRRIGKKRAPSLVQLKSYQAADWQRAVKNLRESFSGVVISLALHIAILLVLAVFVISTPIETFQPVELGWSTAVDRQDSSTEAAVVEPIVLPSVSTAGSRDTPSERPQVESVQVLESRADVVRLVDVHDSLRLRTVENHGVATDVSGKKAGIGHEAIQDALAWIVNQQQSDGSWDLSGPYPDAGTIETKTGATALALLALLGDGHTHRQGEYQSEVQSGLNWMVKIQRENGDLFDIEEQGREAHFYSHAQGTIALCEALALTGDEALRHAAQRAVQFLVDAQNPVLGGWKYRPLNADGIGDLSVTGWALMALHTARMAQIEVDEQAFQLANQFLNSVQERSTDRAFYRYRPDFPAEESQRQSMTAEGLLCRQWLGWPRNEPALSRGVEFLLTTQNEPEWKPYRRNVYAWYYTAQVLHNLGGSDWEDWFGRVLTMLVAEQQRGGKLRGSWHPFKPAGAFQERSQDAGRLYTTVMCVLILETPYRHVPLYELNTVR